MEKCNKLDKVWSKIRWSFPFTVWDQDSSEKQFLLHLPTWSWLVLVTVLLFCTSCHHQIPGAADGETCRISLSLARVLVSRSAHRCPTGRWWWSSPENKAVKCSAWWQSCTFRGEYVGSMQRFLPGDGPCGMTCAWTCGAQLSCPVLEGLALAMAGNNPRALSELQFPKPFSSKIARLLLIFVLDLSVLLAYCSH